MPMTSLGDWVIKIDQLHRLWLTVGKKSAMITVFNNGRWTADLADIPTNVRNMINELTKEIVKAAKEGNLNELYKQLPSKGQR